MALELCRPADVILDWVHYHLATVLFPWDRLWYRADPPAVVCRLIQRDCACGRTRKKVELRMYRCLDGNILYLGQCPLQGCQSVLWSYVETQKGT